MKRSFIREILEHTNSDTISFAGGLPMESLFPNEALRVSANKVLQKSQVLQYGHSTGYEPLKEKIAHWYTEKGFKTNVENILITSGSQQALDIICRYYAKSNISIESPSYLGAINVFKMNGLKMDTIKLEHDGLEIEAFKESFHSSKFAYLIPDFQNPTGVRYAQEKRKAIAQIIKKEQGLLIEDAPYSELYFEDDLLSISSMIPNQSYHLGTFSKTLAPAIRIGWIRADKKLLEPLIPYKETMDLHSNGLSQAILNDYLSDMTQYKQHLKVLREAYRKKMEFFATTLDEVLPTFNYKRPKGGMFIYGSFPNVDTSKLLKQALVHGVVFVPGAEFYGHEEGNHEIRFNFSLANEEEVLLGLKMISKNILTLYKQSF